MTKETAIQELNTAYDIQEIAEKASLSETYMCVYTKDPQSNKIKAFYIKNDDFNLLSDEEIRQTKFYKMLTSKLSQSNNTPINTKMETLGFGQRAGTFSNRDEYYLINQISNKVQTNNDILFWFNNRTDNLPPSDHKMQTTAMKHYILMEKLYKLFREDYPNLTSNYQISGHSLGTHSLTYFLDFLNNDNPPGHLLDESSKIEINLQSIPTARKFGINWIKRPKEMAKQMLNVLTNENILKYIRNGKVSFKFDVSGSTCHTPKGTLEYLHELFDLIPNSNLSSNDKAHLLYSLQQATINFTPHAYQKLRRWAQSNGKFDEERKFLQNFYTPRLDEMRRRAEKQDQKTLQNTTYFPEIAGGLLGTLGVATGVLGFSKVIKTNKVANIILVSVGTLILSISLVCGIKKRKTINDIRLSLQSQNTQALNK